MIAGAAGIGAGTLAALPVPAMGDTILSTSSNVDQFRGALNGVVAPVEDGPVSWGEAESRIPPQRLALYIGGGLGALGFILGAMANAESTKEFRRNMGIGGVAGALLGTAMGVGMGEANYTIRPISFDTTIQQVVADSQPHNERHGKMTYGPYYTQVVAIPESDVLLATNAMVKPFIAGEKIKATFYVHDQSGHIVSWNAVPGLRD